MDHSVAPVAHRVGGRSHGSILNGNYAPNRLSSAWKPTRLANIASPTFIYETSRGGASLVGHEPWAKFTTDLQPLGHEPTDFSTQLDTILVETKKLSQVAEMKTMYRTAIHSLPDTGSSSAGCVSHTTFKAVAELHYGNVDWVQVHALTSNEKEAIFGYVDRRDVAFV